MKIIGIVVEVDRGFIVLGREQGLLIAGRCGRKLPFQFPVIAIGSQAEDELLGWNILDASSHGPFDPFLVRDRARPRIIEYWS